MSEAKGWIGQSQTAAHSLRPPSRVCLQQSWPQTLATEAEAVLGRWLNCLESKKRQGPLQTMDNLQHRTAWLVVAKLTVYQQMQGWSFSWGGGSTSTPPPPWWVKLVPMPERCHQEREGGSRAESCTPQGGSGHVTH